MSKVIVIGAGHNGMIAALHLAKAGFSVTVLERSAHVGGICRDIEFGEGFVCPGLLHDNWLDPSAVGLSGLTAKPAEVAHVFDGGSFRPVKPARQLLDFAARVRPFARRLLSAPPPPILPDSTSDFWTLGKAGFGLRRLGRADMTELMRVPPMCAADWVNEHLADSPIDAEYWASTGALHGYTGPWSAGTAANLLLGTVMKSPDIDGGFSALTSTLASACKNAGVTTKTSSPVTAVTVENGRAVGVTCGQDLYEGSVLAACDPKTALLDLVPPNQLALSVEQQFLNIRARGTTAKWMLGLRAPLEVSGAPGAKRLFVGAGTVDGLERAFDAVKYGEFSRHPVLDISLHGNVLSVLASYVPYELRAGWDESARAALRDVLVESLETAFPEISGDIVAETLWTPADLEHEFGLTGGCLQHAEHALDQMMFMRPTPTTAQYRTPIPGLYLGSGGSHPCGGVTGLPGKLAAQTMIEDLR